MSETGGQPSQPYNSQKLEWIVAATLGALAVAAFALQVVATDSTTTTLETALFGWIQFLLTAGFTWFSARAVSRSEFEQSLKRFAVSAYRRISDIEKMITQLDAEVDRMLASGLRGPDYLQVVRAIVADARQVVRSSSADWADVLGDELLALERIKSLEREKQHLALDQKTAAPRAAIEERLEEINTQIQHLHASLPAQLMLDSHERDRSATSDRVAAGWLAGEHERDGGLLLTCVTGEIYDCKRARESVLPGELLLGVRVADGSLDAVDDAGQVIGRLENRSPLTYSAWVRAVERCYNLPLRLCFVQDLGPAKDNDIGISGWFSVKVLSSPLVDGDGEAKL